MKLRELHPKRVRMYYLAFGASLALDLGFVAALLSGASLPMDLGSTVILVSVACFSVPGLIEVSYLSWRKRIDDMIPSLLSDVASRVRTGFSLTRSLELASESDYGPLTDELKRMKAQLSWGIPFETAVQSLMERVDSVVARRAFGILLEADKAGGKVEEMLDAVHKHTAELHEIEQERRATLGQYTITIYASIFVFLVVAIILVDAFFVPVINSQSTLPGGLGAFAGTQAVTLDSIRQLFLQIGLVEAVVGGLGAGKLGEGSVVAGTRHVLILIAVTLIAFEVFAR